MSAARLRLCVVAPVHWKAFMGGAQYQIRLLLDCLRDRDMYDLHYIARRLPDESVVDGVTLHRIGHDAALPTFGYATDGPQVYRTLRAIGPRVVYQRIGCAYTGISAYYARRHSARLVWHASSDSDLERAIRVPDRNWVRRTVDNVLLSYGVRHADRIVVQTKQQATLLARNYQRTPDAVVGNFHPAPQDTRPTDLPRRVLWIANLKRLKRPEVFVRLAKALRELSDLRFEMIGAPARGEGDFEWGRALMHEIQLAGNVDYLGQLSQDEVNARLDGAFAFVNTSLYEGFPNTFIQAWLRGVPVISLAVNPDSVLESADIGIHAQDEAGLVQAVRRLALQDGLRTRLSSNAVRYAAEFHSMDNARRLAALIEDAAGV